MIAAVFLVASMEWSGVQRPALWGVGLLLGVLVLYATYRGIVRRSGNRLGWALMLLRGLGLTCLLVMLARPVWTRESVQTETGVVAVVVDTSRSMTLAVADGRPRYAVARQAIEQFVQTLNKGPGRPPTVAYFDINGQRLKDGPPAQPTAERTDLTKALTESTAQLRAKPLTAVVLVSDGMDNSGRTEFREISGLPSSVPVHTAGFRQESLSGIDLAVRPPKAPDRAMVNNEVAIEVPLRKLGEPPVAATVRVKRGKETLASQKIEFPAGRKDDTVTLRYTPTQAGSFVLTASIESDIGESLLSNNTVMFPLRVDAEPIRVLYLEGFLRFESKYLKVHLEDDPDVGLEAEIRTINPERVTGWPGRKELTADRLKPFSIVILGDMEAASLTPSEYQALVKWLDDKNKSLLILGGYESFGAAGWKTTPLKDVLPITFAAEPPFQSEEPFVLERTEAGRTHPIFDLSGDRNKDAQAWNKSAPLAGCGLVAGAKPAATVLAVNSNPKALVAGKPAIVLAWQPYGGAGSKTMALTIDTTWHWSRDARLKGQPDTLYSRFWSQTVRWLANRKDDEQRSLLTVTTDRSDYEVGKQVTLRMVRHSASRSDIDLASTRAELEVIGPGGQATPVTMRNTTGEPEVFTGTFVAAGGGKYEAAGVLKRPDGKTVANQTAEFLVQGADLELASSETNPGILEAIAGATYGRFVEVEQLPELAGLIERKERRTVQVQRLELWNYGGVLFIAFLGAVTAEWLIRRRQRLV